MVDIRWLGHAGFRLSFPDPADASVRRVIYIDAWLSGPTVPEDVKGTIPDDADLCLVTHGHFDHSASTPDLVLTSKKVDAKAVSNYEISGFFKKHMKLGEE
jgi:L-ascorbate metabolism protein UlaG (beta-lactamase superfamily)